MCACLLVKSTILSVIKLRIPKLGVDILNILFFSVEPKIINIAKDDYDTTLAVMGFSHNVLCLLVVVSYFVCNHPRLPRVKDFITFCK